MDLGEEEKNLAQERRRYGQQRDKLKHSNSTVVYSSELRRRIELIQDFSMPIASTGIQVTADRQYLLASGQHSSYIPILY